MLVTQGHLMMMMMMLIIVITLKESCMLIDVAIPGDRNVIRKETGKILKHKDLIISVIPVIIGATGTISQSLRQYLSNIPGKHEIKELQKTAILDTAHILRKVLM
jgi:hypothetical protein